MKSSRSHGHRNGSILPILAILALILYPLMTFAEESEAIIQRVQKKFESLSTLSLHFEIRYHTTGATDTAQDESRLILAKGDKFRLESPSRTIVSDGENIWMYDPQQQQVIIRHANDHQGDLLNPRQILFDYPSKYRVEKVQKGSYAGISCDILTMMPKDPADPTRKLQVWVDRTESYTRKIIVEDTADNIMTFEFENFTSGQNMPENTFNYSTPKGVEVIDLR
ncbi:MAG: outer membrane lipoprotein carrier protein LolA [bacterium]|nr:outer membrane lipoprotein carrier protein LolA [bacterium]